MRVPGSAPAEPWPWPVACPACPTGRTRVPLPRVSGRVGPWRAAAVGAELEREGVTVSVFPAAGLSRAILASRDRSKVPVSGSRNALVPSETVAASLRSSLRTRPEATRTASARSRPQTANDLRVLPCKCCDLRADARTPLASHLAGKPGSYSGGGTRTHNPSVNSRMLCRLSYPRPAIGTARSPRR